MKQSRRKPNTSIRIDPEAVHQARVAAITQKKTLGQWLEEAIVEKIEREQERSQRQKANRVTGEMSAKEA